MVAISMVYKGNLHKVPSDVPRKWLMPTPQISLKDFRTLLRRRSRASALLLHHHHHHHHSPNPNPSPNSDITSPDPPPHNNNTDLLLLDNNNTNNNNNHNNTNDGARAEIPTEVEEREANTKEKLEKEDEREFGIVAGEERIGSGEKNDLNNANANAAADGHDVEQEQDKEKNQQQQLSLLLNPNTIQATNKEEGESDKEKRKREVVEKLNLLKGKKHNLVQVLKQIQNAEEELKRRSSGAVRPSLPLQVDIPNDAGSMTRLNTPRIGSDGTLGGGLDGGENDGMLNNNPDARHLLRMSSSSPSPSSDSQLKKPAYNVVSHPVRASLGVSSPSRFAPAGQQGSTPNLPTVSVSGTNYVASSPSPAASGGTSVFRESRIPSPWN